jgi:phosphate transport system permease protein
MKLKSVVSRRFGSVILAILSTASAIAAVSALAWVVATVFERGVGQFSLEFFTSTSGPVGSPEGGVAHAIMGTIIMTGLGSLVAIPLGLLVGVHLSEFGKDSALGKIIRASCDLLAGTPSIIVGLFVYSILVRPFGYFSGWAGATSLGILMVPMVARTSESVLQLVPNHLREAGLALGIPRWRTTLRIVFGAARKGLVTGCFLAIARVAGETSPLLFTALNNTSWPWPFNEPVANVPVTVFNYAMSPYRELQDKAWGAALFMMIFSLLLGVAARLFVSRSPK